VTAPPTSVNAPRLVDPFVMLATVSVLFVATVMFPLASGVPAVGCTCIPVMFSVSSPVVLVTVKVIVIVVAVFTAMLAVLMSLAAVQFTPGDDPVLNWKPAGAFRIRVTFVPLAKSVSTPSAMDMVPSVVQAGTVALAAVSAEMLALAAVMVTVARALSAPKKAKAKTNKKATRVCFVVFIN